MNKLFIREGHILGKDIVSILEKLFRKKSFRNMSVAENENVLEFLNKCEHPQKEYLFRIMHG